MSDIVTDTPAPAAEGPLAKTFYTTAWRWHFYAGLYVAPFLIMLAVTGLIMLWSSVLVGRDGEKLYSVDPAAQTVAVSTQANAAVAAVPGGSLVQYIAPRTPEQPAVFRVNAGEAAMMVAVNPYDGSVLGSWPRQTALYDFANKIHGTLLIGDVGDRLIEIAAGFGVVLIVTGVYLWWPRDDRGFASAFVPRLSGRGRQLWKSLHQTVGVYVAAILLVFLVSGLTWTGIWGERMTQAWSTFPAEKWDNVPLSDATHASMNHGGVKEVPWTLEQTPMPASGSHAGHAGVPENQPVDLDNVSPSPGRSDSTAASSSPSRAAKMASGRFRATPRAMTAPIRYRTGPCTLIATPARSWPMSAFPATAQPARQWPSASLSTRVTWAHGTSRS